LLTIGAAIAFSAYGIAAAESKEWPPTYPETPFPSVKASRDPAIVRKGAYLARAVAHCTFCHLPKSVAEYSPVEVASEAVPIGGGEFDLLPIGILRAPNLTSDVRTGVGTWSDAELARAIRYGIDRRGRPLLYMVGVGPMDDRDLVAIVSFLRSLPPVANAVPRSQISPEGEKILSSTMEGLIQPKPRFPVTYAAGGEVNVARGAYLANGPAMCFGCHSDVKFSPSFRIAGPRFAGSLDPISDPDNPSMELNAPNLTPSWAYGILTGWSEDQFVERIRRGRALKASPMPWENFRLMTDADLKSIFRYLKSLPAVDRNVGPPYRSIGWKASRDMKARYPVASSGVRSAPGED
jgi:hypothetical protein